MPGLGIREFEAEGALVTPYRNTEVTFDLAEVVPVEPPWSTRRFGSGIVPQQTEITELIFDTRNIDLLASGYWIIKPHQDDLFKLYETTQVNSSVMMLSEFIAATGLVQEPLMRALNEVSGVTTGADAGLAAFNNDLFITFNRAAGSNWADAIVTPYYVKPVQTQENIVLDTVLTGNSVEIEDQGYLLRFHFAGTKRNAPDHLLTFYFGGELFSNGYGAYALTFDGNGKCLLWELSGPQPRNWHKRAEWQYCFPHAVMDAAHTMRIIPHARKYIEFKSETNQHGTPLMFQARPTFTGPYARALAPNVYLYEVVPSQTGQSKLHRNFVTGPGPIQVDMRRDQRMFLQISRLTYPNSGTILDQEFVVPFGLGGEQALNTQKSGFVTVITVPSPSGPPLVLDLTSVTLTLYDLDNFGLPLPAHPSGSGFLLPANENKLYAGIGLFGDGLRTPFFAGYTVWRDGTQATITPGEFSSVVHEVSITGPTDDPSHETASLVIEDTTDALSLLRVRGTASARIQTTYDAAGVNQSVLFRGRMVRPEAHRYGTEPGQAYPDEEWRRYEISLVGEWQRLQEQLLFGMFHFDVDPDATPDADGNQPAWKITDIIRKLLVYCGYPLNQIDVPDSHPTVRLLQVPGGDLSNVLPAPFTSVGDYIQRLGRDYLASFLCWEANAQNSGFRGMWRLLPAPRVNLGDVPLWRFTNDAPAAPGGAAGTRTLIHRSEAYPANTSPIRKGSFRSWPNAPEANAVVVTATGELLPNKQNTNLVSWLINYRSFNPPGGPNLASPSSPDYIGRFVPLVVTDPGAAGGLTGAEGQAFVDLICRRLYNFACRAEKRCAFEAELALVQPATEPYLDRKRKLRRGDYVTVDEVDCIIDSCDPSYHRDGYQGAAYEAVVWIPED